MRAVLCHSPVVALNPGSDPRLGLVVDSAFEQSERVAIIIILHMMSYSWPPVRCVVCAMIRSSKSVLL